MKDSKWFYIDDRDFPVTITVQTATKEACVPQGSNRTIRDIVYFMQLSRTEWKVTQFYHQNNYCSSIANLQGNYEIRPFQHQVKSYEMLKNIYGHKWGQQFKQFVNDSEFLSGIDSEVSLGDDEAYELATLL